MFWGWSDGGDGMTRRGSESYWRLAPTLSRRSDVVQSGSKFRPDAPQGVNVARRNTWNRAQDQAEERPVAEIRAL